MKKDKVSFKEEFELKDQRSCEKAIKSGGIVALISAAITLAFALFSFFTTSENKSIQYLLDPWILIDVVLIIILAIFIFKKSRTAATLLLIYFIAGKAMMWYELGELRGLGISLIFLAFYFNAMRATYIWHSKYKNKSDGISTEDALAQ